MSRDAAVAGYADLHRSWIRRRDEPAAVASLRAAALARFLEGGFPSPREEDWRYTNLRPLRRRSFDPGASTAGGAASVPRALPDLDCQRMVFLNGTHVADARDQDNWTEGADLCSLAAALEKAPESLLERLAQRADPAQADGLAALNTAFLSDGAYIDLAPGCRAGRPLLLHYHSAAAETPALISPRTLIRLGEGASATVIELYTEEAETANFTNAVTEILCEPGARLQHYRLQQHGRKGFHLAAIHAEQRRDSHLRSVNVNLGGKLARSEIHCRLQETGALVQLDGLFMADARQHVDNHTCVEHLQPRTRSEQDYRGVLGGHARGVFNGKIIVHPDAQKVEAHQASANLLLSETAEVDTKPALEIYADDVKCSHGATVGELDRDALFYLRSRGIDLATARSLLTYAFAAGVLSRIELPALRQHIAAQALGRLPDSAALEELL